MKEIIFEDADGNKLAGTLSLPKNTRSVVIITHGFTSNKDSKTYLGLETELNKIGIGSFRVTYYGHGKLYCEGAKYTVSKDTTLTKCVNSIKAAVKLIRSIGDYQIGLFGASFGGLLCSIIAAEDKKIDALVLKSSVTEPISFWKHRLGEERLRKWKEGGILHYNELGENFELNYDFWGDISTFDTLKMAEEISCPILMIHGGADTVVPIEGNELFTKITNPRVEIVEGAEHSYSGAGQKEKMTQLAVSFLEENLIK